MGLNSQGGEHDTKVLPSSGINTKMSKITQNLLEESSHDFIHEDDPPVTKKMNLDS
jgi:hypothetical protein